MEKLYRTYINNAIHIGDVNDKIPLLPIGHTTQKGTHIQITLDSQGEFIQASIVSEGEARTIIPATEESMGRTSGEAPHPLCDKLQYIAADYQLYGGEKPPYYKAYMEQLSHWCNSPFCHPKIEAVLKYIRIGRVIEDLISEGLLYIDADGKLLKTWNGPSDKMPEIFNATKKVGGPAEAFIRWSVEVPSDPQSDLWTDPAIWKSWMDYYASTKKRKGLCYITGEDLLIADQHPRKIRHDGDGAKLISSNDNDGFTFRGRFTDADEACGIGYEVTQKAHNALRWLIARQGYRDDSQAIVAWAPSGSAIPKPLSSTQELLSIDSTDGTQIGYTAQEIGIQLSKLIAGYSIQLGKTDDIIVMAMDSATPGRIAVRFYRELPGSEYLARISRWHDPDTGCTWQRTLFRNKKPVVFIGAPTPRDIAEMAYGKSLNDKLRLSTVERLLPCIVDGAPLPRDIVESCVRQACNRISMESWEWEKALSTACALFRYYYRERRYSMALDRERKTRDYLYGRLLALAEKVEGTALNVAGEGRETNAARLMQRFADRPYSTWLTIETSLSPYKVRLRAKRPGFLWNMEREMDAVVNNFDADEFISDRRLTGEFLLGYHCQRNDLWSKKQDLGDADEDDQQDVAD